MRDAVPASSDAQTPPQTPPPAQNPQKMTTEEARKAFGMEAQPPKDDAQKPAAETAAPLATAEARANAASDDGNPLAIHGYLSSQYRGRFAGSQHDNDLYEFLSVDIGDPTRNRWTAHISARAAADLDGKPPTNPPPLFFNLNDTYDGAITAHLYEAHVDGTDLGPIDQLRIGRQIDFETPVYAWFDGAYAVTKGLGKENLKFGAYGGVPVHEFESSATGDVMAGSFAESKLWEKSKARLDWMHLEDNSSTGYHNDEVWKLGLWQDVGKSLRLDGNYSRLNDHNRDFGVHATWTDAEDDLTVQASYYELLQAQKDHSLELDPFFTTLFELFPYYSAGFLVSKGLSDKLNLQGGFDARRVTDNSNQGEFNHDFDRYFLTAVLSNVLPSELVLSATGEIWDSGSTGIASCGADLSRRFSGKLDTAIGTYYSLYKTDLFTSVERDNVRTYYLKLRYHQDQSLTWELRYEYESVDPGPFNTLILGLVWHF